MGGFMARYVIHNSFHGTTKIVSIKEYFQNSFCDILAALDYEIYSNGDQRKYALRKRKEIYCTDCKCSGFITIKKI
jgi:hypothetical protein